MSVRQAQEEISWEEFKEWIAYDRLDPFGNVRGDMQAGIVASAAVSPHCKPGKQIKPADFMPDFLGKPKPVQDWRVAKALLLGYTKIHNKKIGFTDNG